MLDHAGKERDVGAHQGASLGWVDRAPSGEARSDGSVERGAGSTPGDRYEVMTVSGLADDLSCEVGLSVHRRIVPVVTGLRGPPQPQ
jgi:hypothetical protein